MRGCTFREVAYLPIKVKMATPRASSARRTAGIARPNACKPYRRKNRIRHQVAIELGILISFSFRADKRLREPVI